MSITLLIEQNVYRYYALTDHTLTIVYKTSNVFPFHVSPFFKNKKQTKKEKKKRFKPLPLFLLP